MTVVTARHKPKQKKKSAAKKKKKKREPSTLALEINPRDFRLDGLKLSADIADAISGGSIETSIEGASTLTLNITDSERKLAHSSILSKDGTFMIAAGLPWALVKTNKSGDDLTLTFEDLRVNALRHQKRHAKASRGKMTRAEFIRSRVRLVTPRIRCEFICPQLHKKQKIAPFNEPEEDQSSGLLLPSHVLASEPGAPAGPQGPIDGKGRPIDRDKHRKPGFADNAKLGLSAHQKENADILLNAVERANGTKFIMVSIICSAFGESDLGDGAGTYTPNKYGCVGVLQGNIKYFKPRDTARQAHYYCVGGKGYNEGGAIKLHAREPHISAGAVATRVETSGEDPSFYDKFHDHALKIVEAWGGAGSDAGHISPNSDDSGTHTVTKKYEFSQGLPGGPRHENAWDMALRLAEEVNWRRFIVDDNFYYINEPDLMRSRPRLTLSEDSEGVDVIDYDIDAGAPTDQATVMCRSHLWEAPPGSVVELEEMGPAVNGRWLVSTIRRDDLFTTQTTIELRKPIKPKKEPAPETREVSNRGSRRGQRSAPASTEAGAKAAGYVFPVPDFGIEERTDRGQDMTSNRNYGRYVAMGRCKVIQAQSGFPGVIYKLLDGPLKGRTIFNGHTQSVAAGVQAGKTYEAGEILGHVGGPAGGNDNPKHVEIGFWDRWTGNVPASSHQSEGGREFHRFLHKNWPEHIKEHIITT
jgi:hypothetical protein